MTSTLKINKSDLAQKSRCELVSMSARDEHSCARTKARCRHRKWQSAARLERVHPREQRVCCARAREDDIDRIKPGAGPIGIADADPGPRSEGEPSPVGKLRINLKRGDLGSRTGNFSGDCSIVSGSGNIFRCGCEDAESSTLRAVALLRNHRLASRTSCHTTAGVSAHSGNSEE